MGTTLTRGAAAGCTRIDAPDADIEFTPHFYTESEADALAVKLITSAELEQQTLKIFGRNVVAPRLSAWYGDPGATYAYSGLRLEPKPWFPALGDIRNRLERTMGCRFNSVLLNLYRDGRDSIGWHSDDEPELGEEPTIASLSFGGTRRFLLRHRTRPELDTLELLPGHGSLILMAGATQSAWKHAVPKTACPADPRLNLTFRTILRRV
ncbi:MAG: alpha-ketoglutarate-dependent dioxygenase AlkB [Deltaproteobacteria bacterium]|nr:alpha-ketoglutarate-dependent dioxygenase AlkB [Deltaproteobacteria bacterium]MBW2401894.1 alpha-ketoglutarate-dependent dioxygenase AlkB [Deltaproteobacteria bacterium]